MCRWRTTRVWPSVFNELPPLPAGIIEVRKLLVQAGLYNVADAIISVGVEQVSDLKELTADDLELDLRTTAGRLLAPLQQRKLRRLMDIHGKAAAQPLLAAPPTVLPATAAPSAATAAGVSTAPPSAAVPPL